MLSNMIDIGLHHVLPELFAVTLGLCGAFAGVKVSQFNDGFTIDTQRFRAVLILSTCFSLMISWAFADHLLNEDTWLLYARRDGMAACIACYLLAKDMCKE